MPIADFGIGMSLGISPGLLTRAGGALSSMLSGTGTGEDYAELKKEVTDACCSLVCDRSADILRGWECARNGRKATCSSISRAATFDLAQCEGTRNKANYFQMEESINAVRCFVGSGLGLAATLAVAAIRAYLLWTHTGHVLFWRRPSISCFWPVR